MKFIIQALVTFLTIAACTGTQAQTCFPQKYNERIKVKPAIFVVTVNNVQQRIASAPSSYVAVTRLWKDGDKIEIKMPMYVYTEPMPGNPKTVDVIVYRIIT